MIQLFLIIQLLLRLNLAVSTGFIEDQKKYPRVRNAFEEKQHTIEKYCKAAQIDFPVTNLYIRAFKYDKALEVWARNTTDDSFKIVKTYTICALSGQLGPKRQRGDLQIPEGFYHINHFNPYSSYHLSLKINYPNSSDRKLGTKGRLGGDIFIHGNCVTIGCLPLTDDRIKELYAICVIAKDAGQTEIPVHIFPTKLDSAGFKNLQQAYSGNQKLLAFWRNLREGYLYFENNHKLPEISVNNKGRYLFSP